jgi:hypothetical protein
MNTEIQPERSVVRGVGTGRVGANVHLVHLSGRNSKWLQNYFFRFTKGTDDMVYQQSLKTGFK